MSGVSECSAIDIDSIIEQSTTCSPQHIGEWRAESGSRLSACAGRTALRVVGSAATGK